MKTNQHKTFNNNGNSNERRVTPLLAAGSGCNQEKVKTCWGAVGEKQQIQLGVNTHSPLISWQAHCPSMLLTVHAHMTAPRLALPGEWSLSNVNLNKVLNII